MPIEVATAYVLLASPLGSYTTGEFIPVNDGVEVQGWTASSSAVLVVME